MGVVRDLGVGPSRNSLAGFSEAGAVTAHAFCGCHGLVADTRSSALRFRNDVVDFRNAG
jgi:hypothetical protein